MRLVKELHYLVITAPSETRGVSYATEELAVEEAKRRYIEEGGGWHWVYKPIMVCRPIDGSGSEMRLDEVPYNAKQTAAIR